MKKKWVLFFGIFCLFIVSRLFVLTHPPFHKVIINGKEDYVGYSDVQHDSERYANMWYYGLTPYQEHLFEYPPAAIPLMLIPLLVDQAGLGNYYQNYRIQISVIELVFFVFLYLAVMRLPISTKQKIAGLVFYVCAGMIAKDFWYDGLDLVFIGSLSMAVIWQWLFSTRRFGHSVTFWAFFWLSVAVKLLTAPLIVPWFFLMRKPWKKTILAIFLGCLLIWMVPVILFRSSLSVFLFFHGTRPLKYESMGASIVRLIDDVTKTETKTEIKPHFPVVGPVSTVVTRIIDVAFPLSILLVFWWSVRKMNQKPPQNQLHYHHYLIQTALVYLFTIFLTSKIFSRPFHLWYVPLLTLYPFRSLKTQFGYYVLALWLLALDTSPYLETPNIFVGPFLLDHLRDIPRFIPIIILLIASLRLSIPSQHIATKNK